VVEEASVFDRSLLVLMLTAAVCKEEDDMAAE